MDLHSVFYFVARNVISNLILTVTISVIFSFRFGWKSYRIPLFLMVSLLFEIGGIILGKLYGYTLFLIQLFSLFDYYIWSRFFTLKKSRQRKQLIWIDIPLLFYATLELYYLQTENFFLIIPSYSLTSLLIIIVMIYNYLTAYDIESGINWSMYSFVFVYALFNCFFGLFFQFFVYWEDDVRFFVWITHSVMLHIFYLFLPYYQWKIGKNPQHCLFG